MSRSCGLGCLRWWCGWRSSTGRVTVIAAWVRSSSLWISVKRRSSAVSSASRVPALRRRDRDPDGGLEWLGSRDLNPDLTVQSRMSYHWTTPQQESGNIYHDSGEDQPIRNSWVGSRGPGLAVDLPAGVGVRGAGCLRHGRFVPANGPPSSRRHPGSASTGTRGCRRRPER